MTKPFPIGAPTRARMALLAAVGRGDVRWYFKSHEAFLVKPVEDDRPKPKTFLDRLEHRFTAPSKYTEVDVTTQFYELMAARWADRPLADPEADPYFAACRVTGLGRAMLRDHGPTRKPTRR